jgi:hypothetical protein
MRRLLLGMLGWLMLLPVSVWAQQQQCTFHDTGIVNLPAQITVPTNTPLGAVIATGEADINLTCNFDERPLAWFGKLGRCGDSNTASFDCGSVSIEKMEHNAAFKLPGIGNYNHAIFYSPYLGIGMRMKVKYIDSNHSFGAPHPNNPDNPSELKVGSRSTMHIPDDPNSPEYKNVFAHLGNEIPKGAGNSYWKGKLIVELIKIENRWASQKAFDD